VSVPENVEDKRGNKNPSIVERQTIQKLKEKGQKDKQ
jgi:hypothetical protein